jgi:O-antigen/teichoic acid export membrane protein
VKALFRRLWRANSSVFAVAQTILANIVIQGSNIACGVLTARTLAPAGRGELAAIIMWPQLLAYMLTLGTPLATIYYMKKRPELDREFSGASILLSLASGLVGSFIGWFVIPHSLRTYPPDMVHFAQVMVFLAPLGLCAVTMTAQVQTAGHFAKYNLFRFLSPISVLAGLAVLRLLGNLTAYNAALVYLLAGLPALMWLVYLVWTICHPVFRGLGHAIRLMLSYGMRAWGADLLGTVANQVDRVLVVSMLPPTSMGLYVVAQSAAGVLGVIPNAVNPVILPRISGRSNAEIVAATGSAVRVTLVVMIAAALPLFLFGTWMLRLVYGNRFDGAGQILPFLIVEAILDGITSVLAQAFLAAGMPGMMTVLQGCGVLTAFPLMYVLIPRFGLRGAACSLMIATSMRFLFVLANYPFRLKLRPPRLLIGAKELMSFIRTRQFVPQPQDS